jgi:hypothetical protein
MNRQQVRPKSPVRTTENVKGEVPAAALRLIGAMLRQSRAPRRIGVVEIQRVCSRKFRRRGLPVSQSIIARNPLSDNKSCGRKERPARINCPTTQPVKWSLAGDVGRDRGGYAAVRHPVNDDGNRFRPVTPRIEEEVDVAPRGTSVTVDIPGRRGTWGVGATSQEIVVRNRRRLIVAEHIQDEQDRPD